MDYGKGMGIIAVVAIHAGLSQLVDYSFALMVYFFFITGYNFTPGKRTLSENIRGRIKTVYIPFFKMAVMAAFLEIARAIYFGYGGYEMFRPGLCFSVYGAGLVPKLMPFMNEMDRIFSYNSNAVIYDGIIPLNCHLWFLAAMFSGCVLFYTYIEKIRKDKWYDWPAIVIMLLIAGLEGPDIPQLPLSMGRGCLACACMIAATRVREWRIFTDSSRRILAIIVATTVLAFACLNGVFQTTMIVSLYAGGHPLGAAITFLGGISATILAIFLLQIIEKFIDSPTLSFIGRNTMTIYLWNLILDTIFSVVVVKATGNEIVMDEFNMALFTSDSYGSIAAVTVLTMITATFMAKYKETHKDSLHAKLI